MSKDKTTITFSSLHIPQVSYTPEGSIPVAFFENNHFSPTISYIIDNALKQIQTVDSLKVSDIQQLLLGNIDIILDSWIDSPELTNILAIFHFWEADRDYYIRYFWQKILLFLANNIFERASEIDRTFFFTTKFLAFIKTHDIKIDTLLSILITIKTYSIQYLNPDLETHKIVNAGFDIITTIVSKNFNEIVLRLLEEYRNAIDVSNIISKTDIFGMITYVNQAFCEVSGYAKEELIGHSHNIVRHPDNPTEVFTNLWNTIQNKKIWRGIIKNRSKDGTGRWFQSTIVPILDENENILEYISIRSDITNLKNALKNAEEYSNALNRSNLIIRFAPGGKITYVNTAFCKLIWYESDELIGRNVLKEAGNFYHIESESADADVVKEIQDSVRSGKVWQSIIRYITKYSTNIWCAATIIPILDFDNQICEYIIVQTDITDIEISKQNLRSSYERLQVLDMQKDEFLNIASHELRTPMTSIRGYISMILDGDTGEIWEETRTYLERVLSSSTRLLSLINDMLDIAKLESGKHQFEEESIEIREFLHDCYTETAQLYHQKWQKCTIDANFERLVIHADRNKLLQVMINLLGNAHKFTPEWGKITMIAEANEAQTLKIHVIDNGMWIKKSDQSRIFEKFNQAKGSLTRNTWGTGLWLPIAKQIIEKMGWTISVKSEINRGSNFTIELPIHEK